MSRGVTASLAFLAALAAACGDEPDELVVCTREARPGIVVEVRDSLTGAPRVSGTVGIAREASYVDTLHGSDSLLSGVHERPGTYTVELTNPGYMNWRRESVRVEAGECHVVTVRLLARLVPR